MPGPVDAGVRRRILDETRGNPLALIELPRGLTPAELAGGFGLPDGRPLASRIEQTFLQRVQALPRATQLLLLTAAAEPLGDSEPAVARRRASRDRRRGRGAGRGRRLDRARRTRALPASARPLGGLPRGGPERPPRRAPGARRLDRPGPRSRPSRLASSARDGDAGRGGGRGDGALGRPRAGPWRAGRGRRVPAAGGRADARPRHARRALARRGPGEARRRRRRVRVRAPGRRRARAGRRAPARAAGAVARARSRSPAGAGATRRRCCSRRPGGSIPWTPSWPARPTSRRSRRRCSPGASAPARMSARWPRPRARRTGCRPRARPTCSSTPS